MKELYDGFFTAEPMMGFLLITHQAYLRPAALRRPKHVRIPE
jgi:hypothetical protein